MERTCRLSRQNGVTSGDKVSLRSVNASFNTADANSDRQKSIRRQVYSRNITFNFIYELYKELKCQRGNSCRYFTRGNVQVFKMNYLTAQRVKH